MSSIILQNLNGFIFFLFFVLAIVVAMLLVLLFLKTTRKENLSTKLDDLYLKIKEDIKFSVSPKFMELSLGVNELVDLAVEVWRIEQRILKSAESLPENQFKGLESSIQKLRRYLQRYNIEIIDYKNVKYNEGLNLDVLSIEKDNTLAESIVKETIEPTIMCKGQVVRKAKIILLSNH